MRFTLMLHCLFCFVLFAWTNLAWAASAAVTIEFSPNNPALGASFIVTVRATDVPASTSWNTFLRFDPAKVQLTSQDGATSGQAGDFLPDTRSPSEINASGEVRAFGSKLGAGFSGSGILGVFTFTAVTAGTTSVGSEGYSPTNIFGTKFIKNGVSTIPTIGPAVSVNIGGSIFPRRIRLQVKSSGQSFPNLTSSITPQTGSRNDTSDTFVFEGLNSATVYRFDFQLPQQVSN